MRSLFVLGSALVVVSVTGFGCNPFASIQQKIETKIGNGIAGAAIEAASGGKVKVDTSNGGLQIQDKRSGDSLSLVTDVTIPSGFPTDIPRYEGSHASIVTLSPDKKKALLVVTIDAGSVQDIAAWYDAQITAKGYTKDAAMSATGSLFNTYVKGDDKMVMSILADTEKSDQPIQIQISLEAGTAAQ